MAMAPEQAGIGIRRHFTTEGVHPYDEVTWERRDARHHQLPRRIGRLRAARRRVPGRLVAERHQHRGPEVLPGHARHRRAGVARCARSSTGWSTPSPTWGIAGRLLRRRPTRPRTSATSSSTWSSPRGRRSTSPVWFNIGVAGRAPAGLRLLHPRRRRHDGLDPQLVRRGGHDLQGRLRLRHQPAAASARPASSCSRAAAPPSGPVSFMRGADASAGTIKSRRQDPPRRQDGHPQRRPPRRRGVHLVQGHRGAQGPGPRATPASTWTWTARTATRSSTRTPTTRCGSPTSSCRPSSTTTTGTCGPSPPARSSRRSRPAT